MRVSVTSRTAVYGPVRTVVWEGWSREAPPYPDLWHEPDQLNPADDVRCSGWTGSGDGVRSTRLIRMYGPAARCKRFCQPGRCGLASMYAYPASDWSVLCSGTSWISAR